VQAKVFEDEPTFCRRKFVTIEVTGLTIWRPLPKSGDSGKLKNTPATEDPCIY